MDAEPTRRVSRRAFLLGGAAVLALTSCAGPGEGSSRTPSSSATTSSPGAPRTVAELLALSTFYVAHRGSGDNWPEHTLTAYRNALEAGAAAIEISVCATSDGVLVCHHDLTGARVLGVDTDISDLSWAQLEKLQVDARVWLGEGAPLEPVSRLEDVLAQLGSDFLAFVEDKQGTNTAALLDMLDEQARSTDRFVWKQWAPASQVSAAKDRGYAAWGYFDDEQASRIDEFASVFDILGVPVGMDDETIRRAVAAGPPVMAWEVRFHDDVTRLTSLGVNGMMCSNVGYLVERRTATSDSFASGRRTAGDLPSGIDPLGWSAQPRFVIDRSALRLQRAGAVSYLLGSLSQPTTSLREIRVTLCWPDVIPDGARAGVVFGLTGDHPGGEGERGAADGYEVVVNGSGMIELLRREAGVSGEVLASERGAVPTVGEKIDIVVRAGDPGGVTVSTSDVELPAPSDALRAPWVRLFKDYESEAAVEFSDVGVVPV